MSDLVTIINLEYFLGLMCVLVVIAHYTNGHFAGIETDFRGLKDAISELVVNAENLRTRLFENGSPASLTLAGHHILRRSGLKSYIDAKRKTLVASLRPATAPNSYELQRRAFRLLAELPFEEVVAYHLNTFAYSNGISQALLRRVGAIYLRDLAARWD